MVCIGTELIDHREKIERMTHRSKRVRSPVPMAPSTAVAYHDTRADTFMLSPESGLSPLSSRSIFL